MTYVLINNAPDGRYYHCFSTMERAFRYLSHFLDGEVKGFKVGQVYVSDWGNRLVIEPRPEGWSARKERRLAEAFDARECGVATPRQLELLTKSGWVEIGIGL